MRPLADGVAQRPRDRLLADDVLEPLRPPLAGEDLVVDISENCRIQIASSQFQLGVVWKL